MKLFEVLNNQLPFKITADKKDGFVATFDTDVLKYTFSVTLQHLPDPDRDEDDFEDDDNHDGKIPEMVFRGRKHTEQVRQHTDITGTGDAYSVFGTIRALVQEYNAKYRPEEFFFTSDAPSRTKLYRRMSMVMPKIGYKLSYEYEHRNQTVFVFEKA